MKPKKINTSASSPDRDYRLDASIKKWFAANHPNELYFLEDLVCETTFRDALLVLLNGEKLYEIGISDTVDREYLFFELSEILNVRYEDLYDLWLDYTISKSKKLREAIGGAID